MIQVIKYNQYPNYSNNDVIITDFSNYKSFDLYDINIICLNDNDMWKSNGKNYSMVSCANDLSMLKKSISTSNSKIIILLPANCPFRYSYISYSNKYTSSIDLKNMKDELYNMLKSLVYDLFPTFEYEKGVVNINNLSYSFDFYFDCPNENIIIRADKSNKAVAIKNDNIIISTLQLHFKEGFDIQLNNFLLELYNDMQINEPEWMNEIYFYDDKKYIDDNKKTKEKIVTLEKKIENNNLKLKNNLYYKSILYQTGNELQKIIIEILEKILNEHNDFEDQYEEDYLFKANDYTFIVETKGLNGEVQGKHVTDALAHLTIYEDKIEKDGIKENTKCLFFVSYERNKKPSERNNINNRHITIAKRNNVLIINTITLLNIFEDFLNNKIKKEEIIEMFINQYGLMEYK